MRSQAVVDIQVENDWENELPVIQKVKLDGEYEYGQLFKELNNSNDPFDAKPDEIRKMNGLSPTLKRNITRNTLKKVFNTDTKNDAGSRAVDPIYSYSSGYSIFDVVLPPYNLDYLAKIYEISAPHYAAVNAKTANIVGLGYTWKNSPTTQNLLDNITDDGKLDKARNKIQRYKQAMDDWIDSTNVQDTFLEVLKKVWIDYESTGNGYIEIGRTTAGNVGYIGHIPSVTMRIRVKRDGFVQIVGRTAVFFRNFGDTTTVSPITQDGRPNEIIHLKNYTPGNTYYGIPDIIAAKNSLAGAEYADRYNLDYFEYKAVPRYVIVIKGAKLSPDAESNMLSFFRTGLKGKNHRTLYLPLPGDDKVTFEMNAVEAGTQDSSFSNYRKQTIDDILMAHRVPITKISIGDSVGVATSADADKTFKEQVCQPAQNILEKKLNGVIKLKTDALLIHLNELTLTDAATQSQIDQRYIVSQIWTPNEIRESQGKSGLPGGDAVVKPPQQSSSSSTPQPQQSQIAQASKTAAAPATTNRAQQRSNNQSDKQAVGRNPKGQGRKTP